MNSDLLNCQYLLNCNYSSTFEDFSVLCYIKKKHLLELTEMRDRPLVNQNMFQPSPAL